ncbi:hypothetical protein SGUI_1483 [Serinicoccus hydrothermalis]|uniref:Uncharacterized protein n=1 Tax=Serinicoccus hydrothermalis TaxID=1758689 RepID=A0A1B1NBQ9_9MICO|nr:hypothetical protein [Serinicoccus hydrothermalis]ANS78879.1 hypothetical protein SGUI_1483 [Serinicoccus hydrothermalis]
MSGADREADDMGAGVWRRVVAGIGGTGLLLSGALVASPVQAAPAPDAQDKIEQALAQEFEQEESGSTSGCGWGSGPT